MKTTAIVKRLVELPALLAAAERDTLDAETARAAAALTLQTAEDERLLSGLDGKNAEQRAALLRIETRDERATLEQWAREVARRKIELHRLQAEHASLKAICRLMSGNGD